MSGSVKLKIKLKPRPAETAPSRESSGLKRKLEDDGKDTPRDTAHKAHNNREPHKSKKLKLAQKNPSTPAAAPSSNKVKLHIKGPWGKATNGTGNTESPQNSSAPAAQPSLSQQKPLPFTAFRPPAKQVPNTGGQLQSAKAPGSKKRQHSSIAPSVQPHIGSQTNGVTGLIKHGTQSLDTKSEDTNMDSISGRPGTTLGHAIKAEEATTSGAVTHPTTLVLVRIVDKMQRKDTFNIFKEPVTEAMVRDVPSAFHEHQRSNRNLYL